MVSQEQSWMRDTMCTESFMTALWLKSEVTGQQRVRGGDMDNGQNPRMFCTMCGHGNYEPYYPFTPLGLHMVPSRIAPCSNCKRMARHDFYKKITKHDFFIALEEAGQYELAGHPFWYVTDLWERFYAIPVTISHKDNNGTVLLNVGESTEKYARLNPNELYDTHAEAEQEANRRNAAIKSDTRKEKQNENENS